MGFLDKLNGSMEERTIESVAKNLEAVLNTKQGYGAVIEVYGLGGYDVYQATKPLIKALTAEMDQAIVRFEPRLEEPKVELIGRDRELWVRFVVKGRIDGVARRFLISFHSIFRNVRVTPLA